MDRPLFDMGCRQCDLEPPYCPECGQYLEDNDLSRLWDAVALWVALEWIDGEGYAIRRLLSE